MDKRRKTIEFIKARPHLIWYVKDYEALSDESIVEHTLNYGNWDDVQELFKIMGIKKVARIFDSRAYIRRSNYRPEIINYFKLYFKRYA